MNITFNNADRCNKFNNIVYKNKVNGTSKNLSSPLNNLMKQREEIEKQMKDLQKNIASNKLKEADNGIKIQGGKDAASEELKALQKQLADVDKQIAQAKTESINKAVHKAADDRKVNFNNSNDDNRVNLQQKFLSFSTNMKSFGVQNSVKRKLQDSSKILETEIKIDKSRGVNTSSKEKILGNMKSNLEKINDNLAKGLEKINKTKVTKKINKTAVEKKELKADKIVNKTHENTLNKTQNDNDLKGNLVDARV